MSDRELSELEFLDVGAWDCGWASGWNRHTHAGMLDSMQHALGRVLTDSEVRLLSDGYDVGLAERVAADAKPRPVVVFGEEVPW